MKINWVIIAGWLGVLVPIMVFVLVLAIDRRRRKRFEKPPQTEKLLRPPGYSLSIRLDETLDRTLFSMFAACMLCGCATDSIIATIQFWAVHVPVSWLTLAVVLSVGFLAAGTWTMLRAFRLFREGENIRLGLRGEQAVAEVLHEVADCGFHTFHDLPGGDNWNIDHVAVGTRGVFLIETKARRRRPSRNELPAHHVRYDGKTLQFPYCKDTKAVPQAERNAAWLSNYLTKKTGENVAVQPLIVLPGWFVEFEKGNFNVKVMNAAYLAGWLRREEEKLGPAQGQRIIAALDEKCRTLEF